MDYEYAAPWQDASLPSCPASYDDDPPCPIVATKSRPPFHAPKGTWFDPALDLRDPEGGALTRGILDLIAAIEVRKRKIKQADEANRYTLVRKILANGFRCHFHRHPHLVAYSRKADGYTDGPSWLSGAALARTVDLLVAAGLLDAYLGRWGEAWSTYHIKPRLYGIAQACGVTDSSITLRLPPERLVRLRESNSDGPLIGFEPTDETRRWTAQIDAYNVFLGQQDIGLAVTAEEGLEWLRHWNGERREKWGRRSPHLCRPETFKTELYRTFNNANFDEGGRLYGGWWINTPKALRPKITINGQQTVELDYSGCAVRMLYHERDIDYRDDPYFLDALAAYEAKMELRPNHFREGIKTMTQALINDCNGSEPERIRLPNGLSFRPAFKRQEVRHMIEEKHAPIADAFGTGAGLRLQRRDSDLALTIVTELMGRDIAALPIHDSFLTTEERRGALFASMEKEYNKAFGFNPIIRKM